MYNFKLGKAVNDKRRLGMSYASIAASMKKSEEWARKIEDTYLTHIKMRNDDHVFRALDDARVMVHGFAVKSVYDTYNNLYEYGVRDKDALLALDILSFAKSNGVGVKQIALASIAREIVRSYK